MAAEDVLLDVRALRGGSGSSRRMYAIAMKVVTPPRISVATVDPLSEM
ncbi:hypothetical protein [Streptomyces narbonensis]